MFPWFFEYKQYSFVSGEGHVTEVNAVEAKMIPFKLFMLSSHNNGWRIVRINQFFIELRRRKKFFGIP